MCDTIRTSYCGLKLNNPVLVGSSGLVESVHGIMKAREAGAAGVVMKTLVCQWGEVVGKGKERRAPSPHFEVLPYGAGEGAGGCLYSCEYPNLHDAEEYLSIIRAIKKDGEEFAIFASLNCFGSQLDNWERMARMMQDAGADGVEVNLSMPVLQPERFTGMWEIGEVAEIVGAVNEGASRIPVAVKLSPLTSRLLDSSIAVNYMGADAVVLFNRLPGLEFDIETHRPILHGSYAGYGGRWILPFNVGQISYLFRNLGRGPETRHGDLIRDLDICGTGGIASGTDVVKYILAGCSAVQVCSAVYFEGYRAIGRIIDELTEYIEQLADEGIQLRDLVGEGARFVLNQEEVDRYTVHYPVVDAMVCNREAYAACKYCLTVCHRGAIRDGRDSTGPEIVRDVCVGCGLCVQLCPKKAMSLIEKSRETAV